MKTRIDRDEPADALLAGGEGDASFDAWTLDELHHLADLASVRLAVAGSDEHADPAL